jgi:hypothetical protein
MIKIFMGTNWLHTKHTDLSGMTRVCFEEQSGVSRPFRILMTMEGMWMEGEMVKKIGNMEDLQGWAKLVSICWKEHLMLVPKISTHFSGQ